MLSSFVSLLPAVLQLNSPSSPSPAPSTPAIDTHTQLKQDQASQHLEDAMAADELGVKKRDKDKKIASETFIFVRPPPAKSNHPLNLQVQLVPPNTRTPSGLISPSSVTSRQSMDFQTTPTQSNSNGVSLSRTFSNRSESSSYGSVSSFSSVASTTTGRRTIIPLYNLQAHNVLTNVIVDAGTDAKIAKFQKRGIELIDLATLEPVEVWGDTLGGQRNSAEIQAVNISPRNSMVVQAAGPGHSPERTPDSSSASLTSTSYSHNPNAPPHTVTPTVAPSSKRNLFGKLFKKNSASNGTLTPPTQLTPKAMPPPTPSANATPTRSHTRNISASLALPTNGAFSKRRSFSPLPPTPTLVPNTNGHTLKMSPSSSTLASLSDQPISPSGQSLQQQQQQPGAPLLRPPVLGIQPALSSPQPIPNPAPKGTRALLYVWHVKKWIKRPLREAGEGFFGGVMRNAAGVGGGIGLGNVMGNNGDGGPGAMGVDVRFEWKRGSVRGRERASVKEKRESSGSVVGAEREREREKEGKRSNRLSVVSQHSVSPSFTGSDEGSPGEGGDASPSRTNSAKRRSTIAAGGGAGSDDGDESDPEDSETPWVCTLKIRRMAVTPATATAAAGGSLARTPSRVSFTRIKSRDFAGPPPSSPPATPAVAANANKSSEGQVVRIKVGTLSPTPHHPKVVAMLKIPFPLPDVEVERMGVVKRRFGVGVGQAQQHEQHRQGQGQWEGTTLTAEEIKDVVCSTGLWLVVREGFGGVGKVSRKGDGWRIRA